MPAGAQRRRHERVNEALARALGRFGRNDADPARGDFWIIDDFGSGTTKKVYVWRIEIYTRAVAEAVRSMLRRKFPEFDVMLVMDIVGARDLPEGGVRIRATAVATRWNARLLRKRFGRSFGW